MPIARRAPQRTCGARTLPEAVGAVRAHPPPLTRSGTGSAVWAFRTHEVEWSAVTATIVRARSSERRTSPKNARVDRRDDVALVLGAAVVRRDVGALDVDVEGVEAAERLGGEARPRRVLLVGDLERRVDRRAGARPRAPCPSIIAMPRSTGISTKHPHAGPKRSRIGWSCGQVVAARRA